MSDFIITSHITPTLVCGPSRSIVINYNREVYTIGKSKDTNTLPNNKFLSKISNLSNINMIACGDNHSIFLDYNGNIYGLGTNSHCQLGYDDCSLLFKTPQQINICKMNYISCGRYYTMCIDDKNNIWSFGDNSYYQLGRENNDNITNLLPDKIPNLTNVEFIECGDNSSFCKTYEGDYYSWGNGSQGQLGLRTEITINTPTKCENWPQNIISIKCTINHTLLLTSNGNVYACGSNSYGKLGLNDENIKKINFPILIKDLPEIQRISSGFHHSMCIDIEDNLWVFGWNMYGQLGLNDTENRNKPTLNKHIGKIIDISKGASHSFIKTINNKVYSFGYNNNAQIGVKTNTNAQPQPIQVCKDIDDIWITNTGKSRAKSARK